MLRKATHSALVCRSAGFPITSPVSVSSAAYSERVPQEEGIEPGLDASLAQELKDAARPHTRSMSTVGVSVRLDGEDVSVTPPR